MALSVVQALLSQTGETSSSMGPMPVGLADDSENGIRFCKIVAGEVVTKPLEGKRVPPAGPPSDA
jgi:hypothetical protein